MAPRIVEMTFFAPEGMKDEHIYQWMIIGKLTPTVLNGEVQVPPSGYMLPERLERIRTSRDALKFLRDAQRHLGSSERDQGVASGINVAIAVIGSMIKEA